MEYAEDVWTKALAGLSRAEDATMSVTTAALDAFAVRVSREYGVSYKDLMRIKHDVLGTIHTVPKTSDKTPCLGRTVDGSRCKVQCHARHGNYCAMHRAQGEAALKRQREIEAYVNERQRLEKKTKKPAGGDSVTIPVVRHVAF
jgi:hypothetical protein